MNNHKPTFSICVPTYNRGSKALNMAQTVLPTMDDDWELLILDNASNTELESYQQLQEMAIIDPRLKYVRHESNRMFQGNYLACFRLAAAPYIMIVSDEDFANSDMIRQVLPALTTLPNLGIVRGAIVPVEGVNPRNSHSRAEQSFFAGEEALSNFTFSNNYMSGTVYNRELLTNYGLVERLANGLDKNRVYPHLYMDMLVCALCDVITTSEIACFEGLEQITIDGGDLVLGVSKGPMDYNAPYSFGSRIDQFIVLRDAVWESVGLVEEPFNKALFVKIYLRLCEKYMYLITRVNSPMYLQHKIHPGLLHQAMLHVCGAAIGMYPELSDFETYLFLEIHKLHAKYEPFV